MGENRGTISALLAWCLLKLFFVFAVVDFSFLWERLGRMEQLTVSLLH